MAGRGRGRANTLPAWMTKAGLNASPAPGSAPPSAGEGPPPPPPPPARNGQFDDAPEPAPRGPPPMNNGMGEPSGGKRRSRSRDRGNGRNGGDFRGPPPPQERPRSRSRDRNGNGRDRDRDYRGFEYGADRRREDSYRRGPPRGRSRSRSRSRDRRDYRGDYRRGGDRYEDRGYSARGPRDDDYRRNDARPMRREDEAMERGYRRPMPSNGHDDRTSRRYASDYQP
ncbi:hypothetical protein PHYSODRAFT_293896 [Phytophthora sojae]|uniref:Uncharacterized protein n=1 Tax=Phytophthora sojae (strain P6497) TaxID=1094619 RepID=G4YPL6_PHYSP|nr:hypothetical protein PHYSODRAFT_293896 [Phytophthora sojae]EGZ28318.1 hypothetical protein PHYSODRAFT_293896 [Phytophthora sojae]|eukprot:XP_009515593.1 hypothetical protein PHYSODRAFT_293896 [Phytophthora sojae]